MRDERQIGRADLDGNHAVSRFAGRGTLRLAALPFG
jgi:hypothetical protein